MRRRSLSALLVCAPLVYACSDSSSGPPGGPAGPLALVAIRSGADQRALAGTPLLTPVVIVPEDDVGRTVENQTATFTVIAGGGFLSSSTGTANADGSITAPTWTLGKTDVPQQMRVDVADKSRTVAASVQTDYVLTVRFFGAPISPANQAVFTTAAARVRAFIIGALPDVNVNRPAESCTGNAPLNETVRGLLIFAAVDTIDGVGKTLAQAGPCYIRQTGGVNDYRTVIGLMQFDSADIGSLAAAGRLQDVITHEMLHVVGLGTFWDPPPNGRDLLIGAGAPGAAYRGSGGIAGCRAIGGTVTCANSVPVEDCVGLPTGTSCGPGQLESHWKESTFVRELMTAYLGSGGAPNPLSVMSIRSFEDLNYTVNTAVADAYSIAALTSLSAAGDVSPSVMRNRDWERRIKIVPRALPVVGDPPTKRR